MQEERKKLKEIVNEFQKLIDENLLKQQVTKKNYSHDIDTMVNILNNLENREHALKTNIEKPYFARIDFTSSDTNKKEVCYIGRIGTMNEDNKIITVDWRAPISSLYYDNAIGECSYIAPEGRIYGNLSLKRQYEIENRELMSFQDVDTVSNDELLKPFLSTSMDNRLKNIVSTIQKEQNKIIREDISEDIIVQGVAGSGKTTVALHRIAYLVYQHKDHIDISDYMIIGPNKFFVHYISNVLPDLDVNGVPEFDLLEFTSDFLNEKIKLKENNDNILTKYKIGLDYKNIIDNYFEQLNKEIVPKRDLEMFGFSIIPYEEILKIYKKESKNTKFIIDRIERTIMFIQKYITENKDKLIVRANDYIDNLFKNEKDIKKLVDISSKREKIKEEIEKKCSNILKKYFNIINDKTTTLYLNLLAELDKYMDNEELLKYNTKQIKYEDLVALIYLRYRIYGNYNYLNYRHVVVDEAQDYGEFFFDTIKHIFKNATFSIFGDLAQTIFEYRTIEDWNKVLKLNYSNNIKYLNKSYRTTIEIMDSANKINKHLGLSIAEAVVRHGKKVSYEKSNNMLDKIQRLVDSNYKTIAIISKTDDLAKEIYEELKNSIDINLVTSNSLEYTGGIVSISSSLSKGLEFDAVIINKVDNNIFDINNSFDMKLLYVSMTRALHELIITYNNELPKILI